jgi:putative tricarboxylic transport membrane protein
MVHDAAASRKQDRDRRNSVKRISEMLISGGMALLALVFFIMGNFAQNVNPDDPGPGFYPRMLAVLLFIFSMAQVLVSWRQKRAELACEKKEEEEAGRFSYQLFFGTLLLAVIYGLVFDKVNYLITTTCFLLAMMFLAGVRKWYVLLCVAAGYSIATQYLFGQVLMVPLK